MENKSLISIVVLTKNCEQKIVKCLDSVKWADEIIIIDDESIDRTVEIAHRYTDKIFIKKMDIQGKHRNWANSLSRNLWVLSLDSDEEVTSELKEEIIKTLANNVSEVGFTIPRRNYIGNYWIKYGGWYPSGQLKLFRKDKFRWEEADVHCRAFLDGVCGHLQSDIIHYTYDNLEHFITKLNKQTTLEVRKWCRQGKPMHLGKFIWRTIDRFFRSYMGKKGYKDGFIGFLVAFNAGFYQSLSYLKYREYLINKPREFQAEFDSDIPGYF